jgi:hypothetical protein
VEAEGAVRYVVPQRIGLPVQEDIRLFFRVGRIVDRAYVVVTAGETQLYRSFKRKLLPGEMESVTIPAAKWENVSAEKVTVYLEPAAPKEGK